MLAFAMAHTAESKRPSRNAIHAAVSKVSAATEKPAAWGAFPEAALVRTRVSASSARGVGPVRCEGRVGVCWSSVACVRSEGKRMRVGERRRRAGSIRAGRGASIARRLR
eukprot:5326183-Pleurochrysis_carterae.AAC.2